MYCDNKLLQLNKEALTFSCLIWYFQNLQRCFSNHTILCTILFNILYTYTYSFNISRKAVFIQTINNFPINEIHLCVNFSTISQFPIQIWFPGKWIPERKDSFTLLVFAFGPIFSCPLYMYIVAAGFRVVGKGRCRVAISCDRIGWSRGHDIIIQVANSTWNLLASGRQWLAPLMTSASLQPTVPGPTSLHPLRC